MKVIFGHRKQLVLIIKKRNFMQGIDYVEIFKSIPPQLAVLLIAMLPIAENRVSVPIALGVYKMSVLSAIFWSVLGSILAAVLVVFFLDIARRAIIKRASLADRFFFWLYSRTEKRFIKKHEKWGDIALMLFVAVPLPVTGAWTGSIASFIFNIRPKRALLYISFGVIISATIMALVSLGVINLF